MNVHQNARLTPHSRADLVRRVVVEGQTPKAVAAAFGVPVKTVRKWVARFQTEGVKGLQDRSWSTCNCGQTACRPPSAARGPPHGSAWP